MRKLLVLSVALTLLLGLGISGSWADTINGTTVNEITVFDQHGSGTGWDGQQEFKEVEPGAIAGDTWDLRGVWYDYAQKQLYVVAGFNLQTGAYDANHSALPVGDLFIKTDGTPILTLDGVGGTVKNSIYGTYNYAVTLGGSVYSLIGDTLLLQANASSSLGAANPYALAAHGVTSQTTPVTFGQLGIGSVGADFLLGDYYACYDLGFLGSDAANAFLHLTYACGNDGVNGKVPLPGALVLLGGGLVRLVAYSRRKRALV